MDDKQATVKLTEDGKSISQTLATTSKHHLECPEEKNNWCNK